VIVYDAEVLVEAIAESGTHLKQYIILLGVSVPGREQLHHRRGDTLRLDLEVAPRCHFDDRHLPDKKRRRVPPTQVRTFVYDHLRTARVQQLIDSHVEPC
jgi:hypothetical protein